MQTIVFVAILVTVCFVCTIRGVKLKHCTNKKLEINASSPGPIICKNITKYGTVVWRHEQRAILGECKADGNCSPTFFNEYNLTREANSTDSQLEFFATTTVDNGVEIGCEDRETGAIDTCTLNIKGVKIMNSKRKKLVIFENSSQAITCKIIPVNGTIIWRLGADNNYIGECSATGKCVNKKSASYNITREKYSAESHLVIHQNLRGLVDAPVTCEDESGKTADTCRLVIRRHPVLGGCTITTNITIGTVSGHCIVDEFFTSDNNSQCQWTMRDTRNKGAVQSHDHLMSNVSFNYTCKSRWSCRGTCNFTSPLPQKKGLYTYTIMVLDSPNATLSLNITIHENNQTKSTDAMLSSPSSHPDGNNQTMSIDVIVYTPSSQSGDVQTTPVDLSSESSTPLDDNNQTKSTDEMLNTPSSHPDDKNQTKSTDAMLDTSSSHLGMTDVLLLDMYDAKL